MVKGLSTEEQRAVMWHYHTADRFIICEINFSYTNYMKCITLIKRGSHGNFVVLMKPIWRRFTPCTSSGSSASVRSMPYMYWASNRNMAYTTRKGEHLIMERRWFGRIHKMLDHSSNTNVSQLWYVILHACIIIRFPCVHTLTSMWLTKNTSFTADLYNLR